MPKIRSKVWEHFHKDEKHGKAYCRYCTSALVINNPSNLSKHLRSKHPLIYAAKKAAVDLNEPSQIAVAVSQITSPIGSQVSASPPKTVETRKGSGTQDNIIRSILKFIAKDSIPMNVVNGEGFIDMIKDLAPAYSPVTSKIIRNKIDHLHDILFHKKKTELSKVEHISLTADVWTELVNNIKYLSLTAHYISHDGKTKSVLLACRQLNQDNESSQAFKTIFEDILQEWNIPSFKIVCLVTDGESNMLESGHSWLGKGRNFVCFAHRLNVVVMAALEAASDVIQVLNKVKSIVDCFNSDPPAAEELNRVFEREGQRFIKLVSCVEYRFTSIYKMIERFLSCYDYVSLALLHSYGTEMVTSQEKDILNDCLAIFKPFQLVAEELSGEKYPSLSKVIPITLCLKRALESVTPITESGHQLKQACFDCIQARIADPEFATIAAVSTILDPRFKNIDFQNQSACSNALRIVNDYLNTRSTTTVEKTEQPATHLLWSHHDKLTSNLLTDQTCNSSLHPSLKTYLESPISHRFSDPVSIWHEIGFDKHLKNYALKHLSVPATSISPEILFTKAGDLVNQKRSQIKPKRLAKILFLNSLPIEELRAI